MTYEEFKNTDKFLKVRAINRLTGKVISDLDLYLSYILREGLEYSIDYIKQLLNDNEDMSNTLRYNASGRCITYKSWDTALEHPEYSVYVTNMAGLFAWYPHEKLDLSGFDTSNVTDMTNMFIDCRALKSLDLSGFNTSKVVDMSGMFLGCSHLEKLNLSNFSTGQVTNMSDMFLDCGLLISLDLSSFDTSKVITMRRMFNDCANLRGINLSSFNTVQVEDMHGMFLCCTSLELLDLSSFDTSNVSDMKDIFMGCFKLKNLDIHNFNITKVKPPLRMFLKCPQDLKLIANETVRQQFELDTGSGRSK